MAAIHQVVWYKVATVPFMERLSTAALIKPGRSSGFQTLLIRCCAALKWQPMGGTPPGGFIIAPKIVLVANGQDSVTTTEDVAKAITLSGSGSSSLTYNIVTQPKNGSVSSGTGVNLG